MIDVLPVTNTQKRKQVGEVSAIPELYSTGTNIEIFIQFPDVVSGHEGTSTFAFGITYSPSWVSYPESCHIL